MTFHDVRQVAMVCLAGCWGLGCTPSSPSADADATSLDSTVEPFDGSATDGGVDPDADAAVGPDASDPCVDIPPSGDPEDNHARIMDCLNSSAFAQLASGEFPLPRSIDMPNGSTLTGNASLPTIRMTAGEQAVIKLNDDNELSFLRIDGNDMMTVPHNSIVRFLGSRGFVHDCEIHNADGAEGEDRVTGLRYWNIDGRDNHALGNQIHHVHYGVIFDLFPNGANNVLEGNEISDIRCDAVTFRGFGIAIDNDIHHAGWQCLNPATDPIPGGGFYTLENAEGAEITGNHVHQVCGMPLDLDRSAGLVIQDNTFEQPGWNWDGHAHCGAGATAHLIDISQSVILRNTILNDCRHTVSGDPNLVFSADGSGVPTDLPAGAQTAVAFALTHRNGSGWLTVNNTINDNTLIANCVAPDLGLGYFAGRGTGYDGAGQ